MVNAFASEYGYRSQGLVKVHVIMCHTVSYCITMRENPGEDLVRFISCYCYGYDEILASLHLLVVAAAAVVAGVVVVAAVVAITIRIVVIILTTPIIPLNSATLKPKAPAPRAEGAWYAGISQEGLRFGVRLRL